MTDGELLHFASKASGMDLSERNNPLLESDLALELMVILELDVSQRVVGGTRYEVLPPGGPLTTEYYEGGIVEAEVALKRAIVRAAAGIGGKMR
jgi:hypothetical protein